MQSVGVIAATLADAQAGQHQTVVPRSFFPQVPWTRERVLLMQAPRSRHTVSAVLSILLVFIAIDSHARNPIRTAFFNTYPSAVGSRLDDLPSNADHCGVCHLNFDGGGTRNAYGSAVEARINAGRTAAQAITDIQNDDSDTDGHTNLTEVTSAVFSNIPTFPGLKAGITRWFPA
jgi:hypothetical protein